MRLDLFTDRDSHQNCLESSGIRSAGAFGRALVVAKVDALVLPRAQTRRSRPFADGPAEVDVGDGCDGSRSVGVRRLRDEKEECTGGRGKCCVFERSISRYQDVGLVALTPYSPAMQSRRAERDSMMLRGRDEANECVKESGRGGKRCASGALLLAEMGKEGDGCGEK